MSEQQSEVELADRIRRFADEGAARAPARRLDFATPRPRWGVVASVAATVVAAGILTLALLNVLVPDGLGVGSSPSGAPIESPSSTEPSVVQSPAPTPPSGDVVGVVPPPDASVPPRAPGLPGVGIYDVAAVATASGLVCESHETDPELGGTYRLDCSAISDGVSYTVSAEYWGLDFVDAVHAVSIAADDNSITGREGAVLFGALVRTTLGTDAAAYVNAHLDDPTCRGSGCRREAPGPLLVLIVGENGARSLTISPSVE